MRINRPLITDYFAVCGAWLITDYYVCKAFTVRMITQLVCIIIADEGKIVAESDGSTEDFLCGSGKH